jgi:hypothetical protein
LLIALISRLSFLGEPFKNDAGIYVYFGKVLWEGGRLYRDFWETKFPSVPLLMAPLYAAFGNHWWPYVLLQATMGVAGAWALAAALRRYVGEWTFAPALIFGLIGLNLSRLTITGFQLETVQAFLEILSACVVLRSLARGGGRRSSVCRRVASGNGRDAQTERVGRGRRRSVRLPLAGARARVGLGVEARLGAGRRRGHSDCAGDRLGSH